MSFYNEKSHTHTHIDVNTLIQLLTSPYTFNSKSNKICKEVRFFCQKELFYREHQRNTKKVAILHKGGHFDNDIIFLKMS